MQAYIVGKKSRMLPELEGGTPNPLWDNLLYATVVNVKRDIKGDEVRLGPMSDSKVLSVQAVLGVVQLGADVEGYPAWIVVDPTTNVPAYIDTRDDQTTPITWNEWLDANRTVTVIDGTSYVPTDGAGTHLLASVLADLVGDGFAIKSQAEMQALIAANTPEDLDP